MKEDLLKIKSYLLSGVSFAIPFIACGGILIATAIALAPKAATGNGFSDFSQSPTLKLILDIGVTAFTLMLPVLAGYISHAMAGKPGLVAGFIGGYLAGHLGYLPNGKEISAGFLGALLAGLLAGWTVNQCKKIPVPKYLKPIMPILIIPILSAGFVGVIMLKVIGIPIAEFMGFLGKWLETMGHGNALILAAILGGMIAFDMGGPVNKTAFFFGSAMISQGNFFVMGAVAAAICTPPLGLGLATLLNGKLWNEEDREAGKAAFAMGMICITEGAIPFAASDPVRVIPCIMGGSMLASCIAMFGGVGNHAPHGGPIVLPVIDHRLMYVVAIAAGTIATALAINFLKSRQQKTSVA
ncbi:MAG: PTS fructose transporter subunit IIC [Opitutae bacterium]|nr:PTS fructose transporter subunit IIC [Opitutae bacterium]